jgi:uncharacterized lipoprotein NlpE involved in copper resistance
MKKIITIMLLALFLMGCGQAATQSEFYQHKAIYKNWDHMKFSWFGYNNPTAEDRQMATEQGWWGVDVPYVPGQ